MAIFNSFKVYVPKYIATIGSRFGHEVSVLPRQNQYAEYINCKPDTGLLNGLYHKKKIDEKQAESSNTKG